MSLALIGTVRWLIKKDGTRVLQQLFAKGSVNIWVDVREEKEQ